jgi:hypothetical protein
MPQIFSTDCLISGNPSRHFSGIFQPLDLAATSSFMLATF